MISSGPIEDRLALRELVEAYNDAVMRVDADAWAENWAEEGTWSLPGMGEVQGRDRIVKMWKAAMSQYDVQGFFASAGPLHVDGDTAHGSWYQQEFLVLADGTRRAVIGEYADDYVKRDGRWLFLKRTYRIRAEETTHQ